MYLENLKQEKLQHNINDYSILSLAFVGDAVWSVYVRERLVREHTYKVKELHKTTTQFVKAKSQSYIIQKLELSEAEKEVVKRGRNTKTNNKAKNASEQDYKEATSFECLIGFLKLTDNFKRLNLILSNSYDIIIKDILEKK